MLRRRYYPKEKTAREAEGRQEAHAPVWHSTGAEHSFPGRAEDGQRKLTYAEDWPLRHETLCFTGHRQINEPLDILAKRIDDVLETMCRMGYRRFLNGGAVGFDLLCAERVLALRNMHPNVQLIMVLPCATQTTRWADDDCARYEHIIYHSDQVRVLSPTYYNGCMMVRNRHMVDRSAFCLCYLNHAKGGTVSTVSYAFTSNVPVLNLAMPNECDALIAHSNEINSF